jgi:hypothetical protein
LERFDITFRRGRKPAFAEVPDSFRRRLFGVDYIHLKGRQKGDFFVTRPGWAVMESLLPEHWFTGKKFTKVGRALAGATGAVYRVPVPHPVREDFALVIKFNRFCQSVGVTAVDPNLNFSEERIDRIRNSRFLGPFEEFGNLCKLRQAAGLRIPTKTPLAIYSPPARFLEWQLGREAYQKPIHSRGLLASQEDLPPEQRIDYDWERQYILLYRWMDGIDAEQAVDAGLVDEGEMIGLGREALETLEGLGWEVMDHKPRHVIIRVGRNGRLLKRDGDFLWGLVDYELLYPWHPRRDHS